MKVQIFQFNNDNHELSFLSEAGWQTSHFDDFPENVKQAIQVVNDHANELRPIEEKRLDEARANQEKLANENALVKNENNTVKRENESVKQLNKELKETNEALKIAVNKIFSKEETQAHINTYQEYQVGRFYAQGEIFRYQDKLYITTQAHTSQADWLPGSVPALYTPIEIVGETSAGEDIKEFVQPTGAHDAYHKGDKVRFEGRIYESLVDGNAYSPSGSPTSWKEVK